MTNVWSPSHYLQNTPYAEACWANATTRVDALLQPLETAAAAALRDALQRSLLAPQAAGAPVQGHRLVGELRRRRWLLRRPGVRAGLREELAEVGRQLDAAVEALQERLQAAHRAGEGVDAVVACVRVQRALQPLLDAAALLGAREYGECIEYV